ncbi:DUF5995 family protein [Couchioplanes caeruleus]|uniref:Uncharacterized protein n=1 Tax=Couchioplanes caeruleus TaxID=56438 RepID=A0A3N1GS62_9ACTN|nr:DUF5995 family protein [Couchioplanes caeruleus]ROP33091.1 hypothetical protein EDD30_6060 [Couchioplanes caeruleus]
MITETSVWGPVRREMADVLSGHPDDVPAVVDQLTKLQDVLERVPPLLVSNPLADFNRLYLTITTCVLERLYAGRFADPAFLARLDVEFAARYFDALRQWSDMSAGCPKSWSVLFHRIPGPDARPLPSAAAGVNAHINYDLPFALVTTFDHQGGYPVDDSDQHHDYLQINDIFAEQIPGLRRGYLEKWQLFIDMMNGDLDDLWQGEMVEYTRNVAWRNAQRLWSVRHDLQAVARERSRLDRTTEAFGKLLLSPMGTILQ